MILGLKEPQFQGSNSLSLNGKSDNAGFKHKNSNNQQTSTTLIDHGKPMISAKNKVFIFEHYGKNTQPFESVRSTYI